jgi:hypothetical protein
MSSYNFVEYSNTTKATTYLYNPLNQRVAKRGYLNINYLWDASGLLRAETPHNSGSLNSVYIYLGAKIVGMCAMANCMPCTPTT